MQNIKDLLAEKLEKLDTKLDEQRTAVKLNIAAGRSEICDKIDTVQVRIKEVNSSLKGEIKRIETDISNKLEPIIITSKKHSDAIRELESAATEITQTAQRLKTELERVSGQLAKMTKKCLDLEGRSKRQNLRIGGGNKRKEDGKDTRDFVAQLLRDI